jgi:hypothetical protein
MKILSLKKVTPMFTGVIVTCDRYTVEDTTTDGIEDVSMTGRIKEVQTVVSPSEQCVNRGIKEGDLVALTYEKYKKVKNERKANFGIDEEFNKQVYYEMPVMLLDGREHMLIDISDIELKIDEYEYVEFNEILIK